MADQDKQQVSPAEQAALDKLATIHSSTTPQDPPIKPVLPTQAEGYVGGKYKTPAELEAAYKALQGEFTKLKQGATPPTETPPAKPNTDLSVTKPADAATELAKVGLDFDKYAQSFTANGKLTDADYAEIEAKGFPREVVDRYVKGFEAERNEAVTTAYKAAGGEQQFRAVQEWAKTALTDSEVKAYNEAVAKGGSSLELAVAGLATKWRNAVGSDGRTVVGTSANIQSDVFADQRAVVAAMKDPRYGKDSAYTREVEAKVKRSLQR